MLGKIRWERGGGWFLIFQVYGILFFVLKVTCANFQGDWIKTVDLSNGQTNMYKDSLVYTNSKVSNFLLFLNLFEVRKTHELFHTKKNRNAFKNNLRKICNSSPRHSKKSCGCDFENRLNSQSSAVISNKAKTHSVPDGCCQSAAGRLVTHNSSFIQGA